MPCKCCGMTNGKHRHYCELGKSATDSFSPELAGSKAPAWGAQIENDGEIIILYPSMNFADNVMEQRRISIGIDNAEKLLKELAGCLP